MTSGEDETVAISPPRVCGIMSQEPVPQGVGHRGGPERQSGVTRVGFLAHVDRENPGCIDAKLIEVMAECLIHCDTPISLLISVIGNRHQSIGIAKLAIRGWHGHFACHCGRELLDRRWCRKCAEASSHENQPVSRGCNRKSKQNEQSCFPGLPTSPV